MNKRELSPILDKIGEEALAGAPDLWPAVRARLEMARRSPARARRLGRVPRFAGAAVIVLLLGVVTTAVMQGIIDLDPGLRGERAVELVTPLDVSQTRGEWTITLNWGYADANRLVLNYTLRDAAHPDEPLTERPEPPAVRDSARQPFQAMSLVHADDSVPGALTLTVFYDTRSLQTVPETLDLAVWFPLEGGGLGFDVSLPFRPARLVAKPLTVTAGDIAMTLEDFRVTDTMITFEVCYAAPLDEQYWWPALRLSFDGVRMDGAPDSRYASHLARGAGQTCYTGGWFVPVDRLPDDIRLEAAYLSTPFHWTRENLAYLVDAWAALGVRAEIVPDASGVTLNFPDGLPEDLDAEAYDATFEAAVARMPDHGGSQRIDGPWVFTLTP